MESGTNKDKILVQTEQFVQEYLNGEGSGHDWWHIFRVRNMAIKISETEGGNLFFIKMAALLHDIDDWKLNKTQTTIVSGFLKKINTPDHDIARIEEIIGQVSFKGAGVATTTTSIEAAIVQDADRLDAMGAIGIARAFAYGGHKNRLIYHPDIKPELHSTFTDYRKSTAPTINHFYEKLLLLKERMHTSTGKKIAAKRHSFMLEFLNRFFDEWENKN